MHRDRGGAGRAPAGQAGEAGVEVAFGLAAQRRVKDPQPALAAEAVVLLAVEFQDVQPFLDQTDERQETVALQTVLVQVVGRPVGGDDDDRAVVEQRLEQPPDDHGVGDVQDLQLVQAQEPGRRSDAARQLGQRVGLLAPRRLAHWWTSLWTSRMNSWKWTRCLPAMVAVSKNRSISMDLPRPTSPKMYRPWRGRTETPSPECQGKRLWGSFRPSRSGPASRSGRGRGGSP